MSIRFTSVKSSVVATHLRPISERIVMINRGVDCLDHASNMASNAWLQTLRGRTTGLRQLHELWASSACLHQGRCKAPVSLVWNAAVRTSAHALTRALGHARAASARARPYGVHGWLSSVHGLRRHSILRVSSWPVP